MILAQLLTSPAKSLGPENDLLQDCEISLNEKALQSPDLNVLPGCHTIWSGVMSSRARRLTHLRPRSMPCPQVVSRRAIEASSVKVSRQLASLSSVSRQANRRPSCKNRWLWAAQRCHEESDEMTKPQAPETEGKGRHELELDVSSSSSTICHASNSLWLMEVNLLCCRRSWHPCCIRGGQCEHRIEKQAEFRGIVLFCSSYGYLKATIDLRHLSLQGFPLIFTLAGKNIRLVTWQVMHSPIALLCS